MRFRPSVQRLEDRTTPATLLTPGRQAGTAADADTSDQLLGLSTDGRYVLFASAAGNLVTGVTDTNGTVDLFWRDTKTAVTKLVTARGTTATGLGTPAVGSTPVPLARAAVLSADGQTVAFVSAVPAGQVVGDLTILDRTDSHDVFAWSAATGMSRLVSVRFGLNEAVGNGSEAFDPNVTDDGRFVAYASRLDADLIDTANVIDSTDTLDLFRRDVRSGTPTQATVTLTSIPEAKEVVGAFADVDRPVGRYLSSDGRVVAFATTASAFTLAGVTDTASTTDVFARDTFDSTAAGLAVVSKSRSGAAIGNVPNLSAAGPVVSASGFTVVFTSNAPGGGAASSLVGAYVDGGNAADLYAVENPFLNPAVFLVSAVDGSAGQGANGDVTRPTGTDLATYAPTGNGLLVVFESAATNLVPGQTDDNGGTDVFVRDLRGLRTETASVGPNGATGSAASTSPSISEDGRFVAFVSASPDLDPTTADRNAAADVFARDRQFGTTTAASAVAGDRARTGDAASTAGRVSGDGTTVLIASAAGDLSAPGTPDGQQNLFTEPLPLPPRTGAARRVLVVSGPDGNQADAFGFDSAGQLSGLGGSFDPFPGVDAGPPRGATADFNADGVVDYVFAVGADGGSLVRVIDGATRAELVGLTQTYEDSFTGGLFVATGDIDGDGAPEIVVSPDVGGGARIQAFRVVPSGNDDGPVAVLETAANFFAFTDDLNFRGGARVAVGDVDGDGAGEVIVAAGFGGGPRVAVFDGATLFDAPLRLFGDFFAFPGEDAGRLRNGVFVAAGDLNGDGRADLVFGGGPGGGPRVYALDGRRLTANDIDAVYANPVANFFAFDSSRRGGVRTAVKDIDGDGRSDLVVGSGDGDPAELRTYLGADLTPTGEPALNQRVAVDDIRLADGVFVG